MGLALSKLSEEDPSKVHTDDETAQQLFQVWVNFT